jgi:hypothetical protein
MSSPTLLLLQSHSEIEVFKVEHHLYLEVPVLHGRSAWKCHAERCEALDDHALTEWA